MGRTVPGCSAGDWLLLACDGIFDVLSNEEVRDFISPRLAKAEPNRADGGEIVVDLLKLCLQRESKDNCTACLVQLRPGGVVQSDSRELIQGSWRQATKEVRQKYADFFASYGFHDEVKIVQQFTGA